MSSTSNHTAGTLAQALGAELDGPSDIECSGVSSLSEAKHGDATFMINSAFAAGWKESKASIGIVQAGVEVPGHDSSTRALLQVSDADLAIGYVISLFQQEDDLPDEGIHSSSVISPQATIGKGVRIGPFVIIGAGATIGDGVTMCSNVSVGRNCKIGANSLLRSGVVIEYDCVVGENCVMSANVTIGTIGFGYRPNASQSELVQIPHIGNVVIGNGVDIGANSCIDRGKFSATSIGDGTKIDNLVQIGHNCKIGKHCVVAATSGFAGSVEIGDWVQIGANVGIAPHCKVGDGAKIGAGSGVMRDAPAGAEWLGIPAVPVRETLRQWSCVRKLPGIIAQLTKSEDP